MKINLVDDNDHMDEIDNMDERFHLDDVDNKNVVCIMDEILKHEWKWPFIEMIEFHQHWHE